MGAKTTKKYCTRIYATELYTESDTKLWKNFLWKNVKELQSHLLFSSLQEVKKKLIKRELKMMDYEATEITGIPLHDGVEGLLEWRLIIWERFIFGRGDRLQGMSVSLLKLIGGVVWVYALEGEFRRKRQVLLGDKLTRPKAWDCSWDG